MRLRRRLIDAAPAAAKAAATNGTTALQVSAAAAYAVGAAAVTGTKGCPPGVFCQTGGDTKIYTRPPDPPATKHCSLTQFTWCKKNGKWCKCFADGTTKQLIYLPQPALYAWQVRALWVSGSRNGRTLQLPAPQVAPAAPPAAAPQLPPLAAPPPAFPQPLSFAQWDLIPDRAPLNPDGSAWGIPLTIRVRAAAGWPGAAGRGAGTWVPARLARRRVAMHAPVVLALDTHPCSRPPAVLCSPALQNVGRQDTCLYQFLAGKSRQTGVFLDTAGQDRFVLEPVDGYPYQLRIRSRVSGGCAGWSASAATAAAAWPSWRRQCAAVFNAPLLRRSSPAAPADAHQPRQRPAVPGCLPGVRRRHAGRVPGLLRQGRHQRLHHLVLRPRQVSRLGAATRQ